MSSTARKLSLLVLAVALGAILLFFGTRQHHSAVTPGAGSDPAFAPNFTLRKLDGTTLRLADYHGKVVLLDFWATWCAPCQQEIPHFVEWQKKYGDRGLQVIGVSMDDSEKPVQKFSRDFKMNYPVAMGTQEVASLYGGIFGLPVNIVIGRNGKIVAKHLGMAELAVLEQEVTSQL